MSYVLRHAYFLGDVPKKLTRKAYDRFFSREHTDALPGVSNEKVRLATFTLISEDRRPVGIRGEYYTLSEVDEAGRLDRAAHEEQSRDVVDLIADAIVGRENDGEVIDAKAQFAYSRHKWKPTQAERRALLALWKLPSSW